MNNLISAIDIGSSKIKILVVSKKKNSLEAIFKDEEISGGVKKGTIIDPKKVSQVIRYLVEKASQKLKKKISSVYVNLGGSHLFSTPTYGLVSVSRADQIISEEDTERVLKEARNFEISQNKEILELIPREFIVDGEIKIKDPVGLKGRRLEVKAVAIGCFSPYFENLKEAVTGAELEILDIFPSPIAAARAILSERQKELGVCLLDIGAETISLAVFEEGSLNHLAVLPVGSNNITNEIAISLKIEPEIAERIKIEYGCCFWKGKNIRQKIEIGEEKPLIFYQKFLARLIRSKFSKIFDLVNQELKKISKEKYFPAGIVLTGGGVKIPQILDVAKSKFQLNCKIGKQKEIFNLEEDPSLSVLAGLVLLSSDFEASSSREKKGIVSKVKNFFKIFLP